ncbi:hypothetical protein NG2371_03374 [Nocardia gamkensis]|nr:hypothetical protein [Nocardia gamkensis]
MKCYLTDWEAITACETRRDQDIAALRQQISDLEARAGSEIARLRADQAEAAAVIGDHGGSEEDVAELFEISPKLARQLIAAARVALLSGRRGDRTRARRTDHDRTASTDATGHQHRGHRGVATISVAH